MKSKLTMLALMGTLALGAIAPSAMAGSKTVAPAARRPAAISAKKGITTANKEVYRTVVLPKAHNKK